MTKKMKTAVAKIRAHMANLDNENGMEAAQVILILVLVVIVLIPVVKKIADALSTRGTEVTNSINTT